MVSRDTAPDPLGGVSPLFHFRPGVSDEAGQLQRIAQVLNVPRTAFNAGNVATRINRLPALRVGHGERAATLEPGAGGNPTGVDRQLLYGRGD